MRTVYLWMAIGGIVMGCKEPKSSSSEPWLVEMRDTGIGPFDRDGDGYFSEEDCDDDDRDVFPGADEVCDGKDNNCDGDTDEGLTETYYTDSDLDGYGEEASAVDACEQPTGSTRVGGDCDDVNADINPEADEICDGLDNDCDGVADGEDALDPTVWFTDADGDGFGARSAPIVACDQPFGTVSNDVDCDDDAYGIHPGAAEYCDGIDNNCDFEIDDESAIDVATWYADEDGDGFGDLERPSWGCSAPTGTVENSDDCDDGDLRIHPDAAEVCNSEDDDCDGTIDEGFEMSTWYRDSDGDGYGDFTRVVLSCSPLAGYTANSDDCNDEEYWSHPGLAELCDEIDNDCDGVVDEELTFVDFVPDSDGDGYGAAAGPIVNDCIPPEGHVVDTSDCDDTDSSVHPGAVEACNGVDDDCDGTLDEDLPLYTYYRDVDGDDYGVPEDSVTACATPDGYADLDTDCDDTDDHIRPGAYELCNEIDDDCNGLIDDDCGDRREFVLFVTDAVIGSTESTWLDTREDANAYCETYAGTRGIEAEDFRVVYSTEEEPAKDYLVYEAGLGHLVYDVDGTLLSEDDLWDGTDIRLPDMVSWTITGTWNDGDFYECSGSYPSGSWPICQYCDYKFACGSSSDNPFEPGSCCWTGNRAILCMGTLY